MRTFFLFSIPLFLLLLFAGCGDDASNSGSGSETANGLVDPYVKNKTSSNSTGNSGNNTEEPRLPTAGPDEKLPSGKFVADPVTTGTINQMRRKVSEFARFETVEANKKLAQELGDLIRRLREETPLKGSALSALEEFLKPVEDDLTQLGTDDLAKSKEAFSRIQIQLKSFEQFFEPSAF